MSILETMYLKGVRFLARAPQGEDFNDDDFRRVIQEWGHDLWLQKDTRIQVTLKKCADAAADDDYPRAA